MTSENLQSNASKSKLNTRPVSVTFNASIANREHSPVLFKIAQAPFTWVVSDALLINVAFAMAYYIRYELQWLRTVDPANNVPFQAFFPFAALLTLLLLVVYRRKGLYKRKRRLSWIDEIGNIFDGTTTGIIIMIALVFVYRPTFYSRIIFLYAGAFILLMLGLSRWLKVIILNHYRKKGYGVAQTLIVGAGEMARTIMRSLVANPEYAYQIVGFIDDDITKSQTDIGRFEALGNLNKLNDLLDEREIDEVIITLPWQYHRKIMSVTAVCERKNIKVRIVPDIFQMALSRIDFSQVAGIPMFSPVHSSISGVNWAVKRAIDVVITAIALIITLPLMGLTALAIKMESDGPVIFRQQRIGRGGKPFEIFKFRSMVMDAEAQKDELQSLNEADGPLFKMKDDPRRTNVGRLIRKLSIDELPQLYNVLRGDMSLVGPRPNLPQEVEQYQEWHKRRLEIVPGITGMWAVSGRSDLAFDEMILLDIYYIENWSPGMDFKILLKTIPRVLMGSGAY